MYVLSLRPQEHEESEFPASDEEVSASPAQGPATDTAILSERGVGVGVLALMVLQIHSMQSSPAPSVE